jgi:hypothetical protein
MLQHRKHEQKVGEISRHNGIQKEDNKEVDARALRPHNERYMGKHGGSRGGRRRSRQPAQRSAQQRLEHGDRSAASPLDRDAQSVSVFFRPKRDSLSDVAPKLLHFAQPPRFFQQKVIRGWLTSRRNPQVRPTTSSSAPAFTVLTASPLPVSASVQHLTSPPPSRCRPS